MDYVADTWIKERFPQSIWNHYQTEGPKTWTNYQTEGPKTNNLDQLPN
jgi:hypothetical protein